MIRNILIVLVAGVISICAFARGGGHAEMKILDELNLSSEQLEKVEAFKAKHAAKREAKKGERDENREKMKKLFLAGAPDSELIQLHQSISQEHGKRGDMMLEKMLFFKNLLTKEQRQVFIDKKEEEHRSRGPRRKPRMD